MGAAALTAPVLWPEETTASLQLPLLSGSKTRCSSVHGWGNGNAMWKVVLTWSLMPQGRPFQCGMSPLLFPTAGGSSHPF